MKNTDRSDADGDAVLEVVQLVPADKRRIDVDFDDMIEVDPYDGDPPSKRKDSELNRVLSILDSLHDERGNG